MQTKSENQEAKIIIGVIPGYHHLKKVLFELSKE